MQPSFIVIFLLGTSLAAAFTPLSKVFKHRASIRLFRVGLVCWFINVLFLAGEVTDAPSRGEMLLELILIPVQLSALPGVILAGSIGLTSAPPGSSGFYSHYNSLWIEFVQCSNFLCLYGAAKAIDKYFFDTTVPPLPPELDPRRTSPEE